jgi:ribosomal protein S18 acetylase RimI-like enzyme
MKRVLEVVDKRIHVFSHIYLTVQIGNDEALKFYEKFGFVNAQTLVNYYKRVEPRDAYLLELSIK